MNDIEEQVSNLIFDESGYFDVDNGGITFEVKVDADYFLNFSLSGDYFGYPAAEIRWNSCLAQANYRESLRKFAESIFDAVELAEEFHSKNN